MDEFAVIFVLDIDDTPFVGTCADGLAINVESFLGTDNGKGDFVLR